MIEWIDPAVETAGEFARIWGACVLSDTDPVGHADWDRAMDVAGEAVAEIVPTTIDGALALLNVVRLRNQGIAGDAFDDRILANVEAGLRNLSAA